MVRIWLLLASPASFAPGCFHSTRTTAPSLELAGPSHPPEWRPGSSLFLPTVHDWCSEATAQVSSHFGKRPSMGGRKRQSSSTILMVVTLPSGRPTAPIWPIHALILRTARFKCRHGPVLTILKLKLPRRSLLT